ncbi:cyclohexyl-isocyanide hydratase [Paenibacillus phyllosphaerae]|uniref:Cyclohexyl-isocyanide hydratase n=1 Tax=Paenibacillus phyllosphaerae TaxID=274593 RepID=A0A7W5AXR7_9BACL|nr:DJ-1/PfpI family protein [Paenibacillus phyllosphaerae]MBB3110221.1 cyclohexyl-isocyanide hydratase [Paenibacillus phyllosphaerae]
MKVALVLFDGVTFLDFAGFYDVITRLKYFEPTKDTTWDICGLQEEITDELGLKVKVNKVGPDLAEYDLVFVPGGMGTRALRFDEAFVRWLEGARQARYLVSVCTGALLLGAAGMLKEKRATTHPYAYDLLEPYCQQVLHSRIVHDGHVVTAGGVSTSIDLGLYVIGLFLDDKTVQSIRRQMDYPYVVQGLEIV